MFWEAGMNDEGVVLEVIAVDVGSCPWGWGWVDMEVPLWWMFSTHAPHFLQVCIQI